MDREKELSYFSITFIGGARMSLLVIYGLAISLAYPIAAVGEGGGVVKRRQQLWTACIVRRHNAYCIMQCMHIKCCEL
jgi:hypothetical protein